MPVSAKLPGYHWFAFLKDAATRLGVYVGVALSLIFTMWLLLANRVPFLDAFAMPRNVIAAGLLLFFASIPVLRFYRSPSDLLLSSFLAWGLFTLTYGLLCLKFVLLDQYYSTFQVFVLGTISYLLLVTLSWIGTIIWRVRATDGSHTRH
ncbi:MAG TPA: hypothetical protein VED66_08065 [Candidatus Sulfotelmatobacter sp.]|nr:hypothetical protein [Candidatus Sulfotelmatobacter sp.]